ncbi:hypothetical protein ACFY3U_07665 [Micromonospora sp. NPDC000089]|uniref:hypothetical protein n=1 Tax=unclassified Micromonospora TaxID=2617518 RepID=UPI00367E5904
MSYPDQVPARRPVVVTLAAAVLGIMAVVAGAYAVATLLALGGTVDRFRAAAPTAAAGQDDVDTVVALVRAVVIVGAVLTVLVGLLLVGLAAGLLARRAGARVATWVVCGFGLLCGCGGLVTLIGQRVNRLPADAGSTERLVGLLGDAYPSWWLPVNGALLVGQALGYLVVALLLVLPASAAWFRRPRPTPPPGPHPPASPPYGPLPPPGPYPPHPATPHPTAPPQERP